MKLLILTVILSLVGCGDSQNDAAAKMKKVPTTSKNTSQVTPLDKSDPSSSYALVVDDKDNKSCDSTNNGQLIYDQTNVGFYYCDGNTSTWTAIDVNGTAGKDGAKGETGAQGVQGVIGVQGAQGVQGVQGVQGITGTSGVSAPTIVAVYSSLPSSFTNSINGSMTANYLQAIVYSDGTMQICGEIISGATVYSPSFVVGSNEANNSYVTVMNNLILGSKTLAVSTSGANAVIRGFNTYGDTSNFTIGLQVINNGADIDTRTMVYFVLDYVNSQN